MSEPPDDRESARARLQAVRERFGARLAERVAQLLVEIARARAGEIDLVGPIASAHRLAGTAGSYGYTEAGEHAAVVEDALHRIVGNPASADAVWTELDAALQRLQAASPSL
jgi:HPt (histidine-containing phosphotransfer) domain-containing protein